MPERELFLSRASRIANLFLAGAAVALVLVFAYFFYHYSWTGQRRFAGLEGVVIHYAVPLCLAVLMLACLKLRPVYKVNLVLLGISVIAASYMGEFVLSLVGAPEATKPAMTVVMQSSDKNKAAAELSKRFGTHIDTRSVSDVIAEFRAKGVDAVPIIAPSNNLFITEKNGEVKSAISDQGDELIPLGAISNRHTILCNEDGSYVSYGSDQYGFHNPREIWNSGNVEIAVLGDSFAQGYCVPPDNNFVSLIRKQHPLTLNLAMAGDGPLMMLATLKEYLPPLRPKIVLWFYFEGNDLSNLQKERSSALLRRYLKDDFTQQLTRRQATVDREIINDIPRQRALEEDRRRARNENETNRGSGKDAVLDLLKLSKAKTHVAGWGGQLHFIYLPDWPRYKGGNPGLFGEQRARILEIVEAENLPLIDLEPTFHAHQDPLSLFPFREPGHYTPEGHRIVAGEVLKAMPPVRNAVESSGAHSN
jgi:hypothetical protein